MAGIEKSTTKRDVLIMPYYFREIDFEKVKRSLGLKKKYDGKWNKVSDKIAIKNLISGRESKERNLSYLGLMYSNPGDGHRYKTQTDTILFLTEGEMEFCYEKSLDDKFYQHFSKGDAIRIPPPVVRRLNPGCEKFLEIELIVQPRYKSRDEIHVYD